MKVLTSSESPLTLKLKDVLARNVMFKKRFEMVVESTQVVMVVCLLAEITKDKLAYFSIVDIVKFCEEVLDEPIITTTLVGVDLSRSDRIQLRGLVRTCFGIKSDCYGPLYQLTFGRDEGLVAYIKGIDVREIGLVPGERV